MATIIPNTSNITHSILVNDLGVLNASCSTDFAPLVLLRTMNPPIITRDGRTNGTKLNFNTTSLNAYIMRRKAETLQYRKNQSPLSKRQSFAKISQTGSGSYYYSNNDLLQRLEDNLNCPNLDLMLKPPTNSGIHDYKSSGYYYDVNVTYFPSL
jgi:hypothetical protein